MLLTPYILSCSAPSDHLLLAEATENSFKSDACMYTSSCTCSIHTHIVHVHVHVHVVYTLYVNSYKQQLPLAACVEDEGFSTGIYTATHVSIHGLQLITNICIHVSFQNPSFCYSCAAGYESDRESSCSGVSGDDCDGDGDDGERGESDMWSIKPQGELPRRRNSSDDVRAQRGSSRGSSESFEMKTVPDKSGQSREEGRGAGKGAAVERLQLVARSPSPASHREDSGGAGEQLSGSEAVQEGERTSGTKEHIFVVSREGATWKEAAVEDDVDNGRETRGEEAEESAAKEDSKREEEDGEGKQRGEDEEGYTFTLALISRRSRHRAGTNP